MIACEALSTTKERYAFGVFERAFQDFGLPRGIRTDNGVPFASAHALYGLSKLSVWWLRLGIQLERITPGHPEQSNKGALTPSSIAITTTGRIKPSPCRRLRVVTRRRRGRSGPR